MPTYTVHIDIQSPPDAVFTQVADLLQHPTWAADRLEMQKLTSGPIAIGSRYRSTAQVQGRPAQAELCVTDYQPPTRFAFSVTDFTGTYTHQFTLEPREGGTRIERRISGTLSFMQTLLFWLVYPIRKRPNSESAMQKLKTRCEQRVSS